MKFPNLDNSYVFFFIFILLFSSVGLTGLFSMKYANADAFDEAQAYHAIKNKNQELASKGFSQQPNDDTQIPLATKRGDGYYQFFTDGHGIWWSKDTGAHEVHGDILTKWRELNFEFGKMGFPMTDELSGRNGAKYNQFQKGFIVWTPSGGAHESESLNFLRNPAAPNERVFFVALSHLNIYNTRDDIGPGDWCLFVDVNGKAAQVLADAQVRGGYEPLGGYTGNYGGQNPPTIKAVVGENEKLRIQIWGWDNDGPTIIPFPPFVIHKFNDHPGSYGQLAISNNCIDSANYDDLPSIDVSYSRGDNWGLDDLGGGDQKTHHEDALYACDTILSGPGQCLVDYEITFNIIEGKSDLCPRCLVFPEFYPQW